MRREHPFRLLLVASLPLLITSLFSPVLKPVLLSLSRFPRLRDIASSLKSSKRIVLDLSESPPAAETRPAKKAKAVKLFACSVSVKDTPLAVDAEVLNDFEGCYSVQLGPLSFPRMKAGSSVTLLAGECAQRICIHDSRVL